MHGVQVGEEVRQQAWRLGQHTCLALWGGNNEVEQALGWSPESTQNPLLYAVDYAELFVHTVREALREVMAILLNTRQREGRAGAEHAWLTGQENCAQVNSEVIFLDSSPSNGLVAEDPYVKRSASVSAGQVLILLACMMRCWCGAQVGGLGRRSLWRHTLL
jgi:hypothetical protein